MNQMIKNEENGINKNTQDFLTDESVYLNAIKEFNDTMNYIYRAWKLSEVEIQNPSETFDEDFRTFCDIYLKDFEEEPITCEMTDVVNFETPLTGLLIKRKSREGLFIDVDIKIDDDIGVPVDEEKVKKVFCERIKNRMLQVKARLKCTDEQAIGAYDKIIYCRNLLTELRVYGPENWFTKYSEALYEVILENQLRKQEDQLRDRINHDSYSVEDTDDISDANSLSQCPCCGAHTLYERGAYDICEECGWEDDGTIDGTLKYDIREYRKIYLQRKKKEPSYRWMEKTFRNEPSYNN